MSDHETPADRNCGHRHPARSGRDEVVEVELETLRAVKAYGSGVRTTLRNNATAYGFSVTITAAFGLVASSHGQSAFTLQTVLLAAGAAAAFLLVETVASRVFQRGLAPRPRVW